MIESPMEILNQVHQNANQALKIAKHPEDHQRLLSKLYAYHDKIRAESMVAASVTVACKAGCNLCCYMKVDAQAHEIIFLYNYLIEHSSCAEIETIKERCNTYYHDVRHLSLEEHLGCSILCPLNVNSKCFAYSARPYYCRNFHAQNYGTCQYSFDNPDDMGSPESLHVFVKAIGSASLLGCSLAYTDAGYDQRAYDLCSGLCHIFQDPRAVQRWRSKKSAFPKDCISKQQQMES